MRSDLINRSAADGSGIGCNGGRTLNLCNIIRGQDLAQEQLLRLLPLLRLMRSEDEDDNDDSKEEEECEGERRRRL